MLEKLDYSLERRFSQEIPFQIILNNHYINGYFRIVYCHYSSPERLTFSIKKQHSIVNSQTKKEEIPSELLLNLLFMKCRLIEGTIF